MRSRDQIMESVHRRFTKAAIDACDQAAVDARNAKVYFFLYFGMLILILFHQQLSVKLLLMRLFAKL